MSAIADLAIRIHSLPGEITEMVSTRTRTATNTYDRLDALKIEFEITLLRLNVSRTTLEFYKNLLDKRLLKKISFYALDSNHDCKAQLDLEIDWDEHDRLIFRGKTTVQIDNTWKDKIIPKLETITDYFNRFKSDHSLILEERFCYRDGVNLEKINQELGLKFGEEILWTQGKIENWEPEISKITALPEIKYPIKFQHSIKDFNEKTFGAWSDDKTEEEIIQEIYESRNSNFES